MDIDEFKKHGHRLVDWMAEYMGSVGKLTVRSQVKPGQITALQQEKPPKKGESMDSILEDFETNILPGVTHWQHPKFFAYFPANAAPPSILAEMLVSAMAAQCMLWQTSPAATEMEQVMVDKKLSYRNLNLTKKELMIWVVW